MDARRVRAEGLTWAEVGAAVGIGGERCRQVVQKLEREKARPGYVTPAPDSVRYLEVRTANLLLSAGFKTKADVVAFLGGRPMRPGMIAGLGKVMCEEVMRWIGAPTA